MNSTIRGHHHFTTCGFLTTAMVWPSPKLIACRLRTTHRVLTTTHMRNSLTHPHYQLQMFIRLLRLLVFFYLCELLKRSLYWLEKETISLPSGVEWQMNNAWGWAPPLRPDDLPAAKPTVSKHWRQYPPLYTAYISSPNHSLHPIQTNWCPHLHHPHHFYARCPSCHNPPNLSWLGICTKYAGLYTQWLVLRKENTNKKAVLSQRWPRDAPIKVNKQPHLQLRSRDSCLTQFNRTLWI